MDRREFLKAGICLLPAVMVLQGCAGPAKYDVAKYGQIRRLGVLEFSSTEIEFWTDIDRSSNMYSSAGANSSKAGRFEKSLRHDLDGFYPKMLAAAVTTLEGRNIRTQMIPVPRTAEGRASANYKDINEPLLLECKAYIGFVLVNDGSIMPSVTAFSRLVGTDGSTRLEKHLCIGYGKNFVTESEVIAMPTMRYESEAYINSHPDKVANDLIGMGEYLGKAIGPMMAATGA